ncbi:MAG: class I SAM-dependent methyltransferase, partial [Acidimicrobiales bacterium]|nr:class I SAM-dependent methyltransferase [Acidimicrobiales bacterium]
RGKAAEDGSPVYRDLHVADLTAPLEYGDGAWGAVVSAGTFTHGHVGHDAFDELYRIVRPGALFVVGINPDHFEGEGFADRFRNDTAAGRITAPDYLRIPTYSLGEHVDRLSVLAVFRTT